MGGPGSGNTWQYGAKDLTTDYRSFDVRRWAREGLLETGSCFGWNWHRNGEKVAGIEVQITIGGARLVYRTRDRWGDWESMDYTVPLLSQPMPSGGTRQWFACPVVGCGRRVAKLYGGKIFACRHCHDLAYPSQRETRSQRLNEKVRRIERRLGWEPYGSVRYGARPKGMHRKTFYRLLNERDSADNAAAISMIGQLEKLRLSIG